MDTVRRHSVADVPIGKNRNTPVLVHCGAGVGRTGVTIACDVLLTSLDHNIVRSNLSNHPELMIIELVNNPKSFFENLRSIVCLFDNGKYKNDTKVFINEL